MALSAPTDPTAPVESHRVALSAAVVSGSLVAVQARLNGELGVRLDDALLAALVSFATGLVVVGVVVGARPAARRRLPLVRQTVWWHRLGGLGGASLVGAGAFAAPRVGIALLTVGIVAGQTTGGLLVDRAGLGPGGPRPLSPPRLIGAALALVAVTVAAVGRGSGDVAPLLVVAVVLAGAAISVQQALNGRVRAVTGDASVATLVNFVVGTTVLLAAWLLVGSAADRPGAGWPGEWWLYLGGAIGASFVAVAAVVVTRVGVLRLGLAVIAGQLAGAVLIDLLAPSDGAGRLGVATVAGIVLTMVAVVVSGRR